MTYLHYLDLKWQLAVLRFSDADTAEIERRIADYEQERNSWELPEDFAGFVVEKEGLI